jgi:hypothetical protein
MSYDMTHRSKVYLPVVDDYQPTRAERQTQHRIKAQGELERQVLIEHGKTVATGIDVRFATYGHAAGRAIEFRHYRHALAAGDPDDELLVTTYEAAANRSVLGYLDRRFGPLG